MAEVFRIKLAMGTATSGGGEWRMYDDREEMEVALFNAMLEVEARGDVYRNPQREMLRAWVLRFLPQAREKDKEYPDLRRYGIRNVFAVEQFIDGEWVALKYRIIPPSLERVE